MKRFIPIVTKPRMTTMRKVVQWPPRAAWSAADSMGPRIEAVSYTHLDVYKRQIRAHAGLDIGGTMIGMHLRDVAVPVRLSLDHIGPVSYTHLDVYKRQR